MKALVTGGAGFIGSNLVGSLVRDGYDVTVLDNLSSGFRQNLAPFPSVTLCVGDVTDSERLDSAMAGAQVVLHLAASVASKRSIKNPIADSGVNVLGTIGVLETARRHGIREVAFSSPAAIFGHLKYLPINESEPAEPDSPYGVGKLAAERMHVVHSKLHGIGAVCLRCFSVCGVNQRYHAYGNLIPILAREVLRSEPIRIFGDGAQTRDVVTRRGERQCGGRATGRCQGCVQHRGRAVNERQPTSGCSGRGRWETHGGRVRGAPCRRREGFSG